MKIFKIEGIILLLISTFSYAGPPFVTDDPEPIKVDSWEVNYAVAKSWQDGSASLAIPSVDINYGLTDNIQLHAQPKYSSERNGNIKEYGFDNTEIGIKYRFYDEKFEDRHVMMGVYPMVQLPTGAKRLGDTRGRIQFFLPIWMQLDSGPWTVYGGAGYRINHNADSINSWFLGTAAMYSVSDHLQIGGEIFRESKVSMNQTYTSGFNLGGVFNISDDYSLLFSAGRGLNNVESSKVKSAYVALQVIY